MAAPELSRGQAVTLPKELISYLNSLTQFLNNMKAGANPDAPVLVLSIDSDDAVDDATVWALANELKADVNLLITYVNLFAENVNNLQIAMRNSGLLEEE